MCRDYISNVNTTLQKVLSSWSNYTENIHLLKTWLEEKRNEHPKEVCGCISFCNDRDIWNPPGRKALYMTGVVVVVASLFLILEINFWQGSALNDFIASV